MMQAIPEQVLTQLPGAEWLPSALQAPWAQTILGIVLLTCTALALHLVARRYLLKLFHAAALRSRMQWDEVVFEHRALHRVSLLIPLLAVQNGLAWLPGLPAGIAGVATRILGAAMFVVGAATLDALLSAGHTLYQRLPAASTRPIKSYVQLTKIFLYTIAGIFVIARLANQTPWFLVSGLGAMMAIIMLVFRDTLLSLVASVQLTNNDLIRVGDWIEMPQFAADGDVVDIALNTVRVQNWDKTITVIPTHKFLENSFKNWRGMTETGGRRIKRSLFIDMSTVRFLDPAEVERFSRFALLKDYMQEKAQELMEHNARADDDPGLIPNARRLTNLGTLRAYIAAYLRRQPDIHPGLTFLVRQLQPTPEGLPLEIYVFTSDTRWAVYEGIQADIFDHILAMVPEFGLRVYQQPSGANLEALRHQISGSSLRTRGGITAVDTREVPLASSELTAR